MSTVLSNPLGFPGAGPREARLRSRRIAEDYRDRLYARTINHPPPQLTSEEIEAHFKNMPLRYWERVSGADLTWGLETIHTFLQTVGEGGSPGVRPALDWRHCPDRGYTRVMLCTWDRAGLLAKAAACFSAVRLNILQADVYTRSDNIVLDVFRICDAEQCFVTDAQRLEKMLFLLEGSLTEPPRFASYWASTAHKHLGYTRSGPVKISFDNEHPGQHTLLSVEAPDRVGLLSDILDVLREFGINVAQAVIDTDEEMARDLFFIDQNGEKILDANRLEGLSKKLSSTV